LDEIRTSQKYIQKSDPEKDGSECGKTRYAYGCKEVFHTPSKKYAAL
jgi:hypothetical protein